MLHIYEKNNICRTKALLDYGKKKALHIYGNYCTSIIRITIVQPAGIASKHNTERWIALQLRLVGVFSLLAAPPLLTLLLLCKVFSQQENSNTITLVYCN